MNPAPTATALERLHYRSRAVDELGSLHLFVLLQQARQRNHSCGLSGHLVYRDDTFEQWIEGPPEALDAVWASIQRDPRHVEIELLSRHPVAQRIYPDWSMSFSTYPSLNPFKLTGFTPLSGGQDGPHTARQA